jgi:hypothetical protein
MVDEVPNNTHDNNILKHVKYEMLVHLSIEKVAIESFEYDIFQ